MDENTLLTELQLFKESALKAGYSAAMSDIAERLGLLVEKSTNLVECATLAVVLDELAMMSESYMDKEIV